MRKLLYPLFFLGLTLFLINSAYAQDEIDLSTFPQGLADALNISDFAGGILATIIICLMFMLPVVVYTKTLIPPLLVGFLCMCFCVAIGYVSYWFLLTFVIVIALLLSGSFTDLLTRRFKR